MLSTTEYFAAWQHAIDEARKYQRPMGLEKAEEYGRTVYRVKMIPVRPDQRFGWELRCQVVEPTEPDVRCPAHLRPVTEITNKDR